MAGRLKIKVRRYEAADHDQVLALAPRLAEGVAGWRRREAVLSAVTGWVSESTKRSGEPGPRGAGCGRALMAAVEEWAGVRGVRRVVLETGAANQGVLKFYERLGFVPEDIRLSKVVEDPPG